MASVRWPAEISLRNCSARRLNRSGYWASNCWHTAGQRTASISSAGFGEAAVVPDRWPLNDDNGPRAVGTVGTADKVDVVQLAGCCCSAVAIAAVILLTNAACGGGTTEPNPM